MQSQVELSDIVAAVDSNDEAVDLIVNGQPMGLVTGQTNPLTGGIEVNANGVALKIPYVIEQSAVPAALTGTTAETTLATIDVPAMGVNDWIRITALFTSVRRCLQS